MNLKHLAVFHAVAQAGSISGAAERLFVSQPVVSRQVRELEANLGLALLERMPRGVRLTEAGRMLAEYAGRMFALQHQAEALLKDLRGLRAGQLVLGASMTIGNYLLPPVLAAFQRKHPEVEVSLEVANSEVIHRRVLGDRVDIGFTEGLAEAGDLVGEVFMSDELVVVGSPDHPRADGPPVSVAELCGEPWVMRELGSGTRAVFEESLRERGLEPSRVMSMGSPEAVKRAVLAGAGLAAVSSLTVSAELDAGLLARLPVSDLELTRALHRIRLPHREHGPALSAFMALLGAAVGRMQA